MSSSDCSSTKHHTLSLTRRGDGAYTAGFAGAVVLREGIAGPAIRTARPGLGQEGRLDQILQREQETQDDDGHADEATVGHLRPSALKRKTSFDHVSQAAHALCIPAAWPGTPCSCASERRRAAGKACSARPHAPAPPPDSTPTARGSAPKSPAASSSAPRSPSLP
eukprot:1412709-Rhodomonas_salina.1